MGVGDMLEGVIQEGMEGEGMLGILEATESHMGAEILAGEGLVLVDQDLEGQLEDDRTLVATQVLEGQLEDDRILVETQVLADQAVDILTVAADRIQDSLARDQVGEIIMAADQEGIIITDDQVEEIIITVIITATDLAMVSYNKTFFKLFFNH
jgi:hypothetical protein